MTPKELDRHRARDRERYANDAEHRPCDQVQRGPELQKEKRRLHPFPRDHQNGKEKNTGHCKQAGGRG